MADGLLMNLDVGGGVLPIRSAPVYKGGRWTDRVRAKRAAQHWDKKQKQFAAGGGSGGTATGKPRSQAEELIVAKTRGLVGGRGGKRKRGGDDDDGDAGGGEGHGEGHARPTQRLKSGGAGGGGESQNNSTHHAPPEKGGQFISSLWTYNPTSSTPAAPSAPETDQAPTNAPLSDGSATFTTLGLSPSLSIHLTSKLHLSAPTAIQKAAIPELLSSDSDAFIQAQTGSGKTLTYLLPIIDRIQSLSTGGRKLDRTFGLFALVLAPTRELAAQILTVLTQLTGSPSMHWITPTCVTGGEKRKSEKARLRKGCNILIATPGRLLDHLEMTESLDVTNVRWMVMDEGDRLADQGFEPDIQKIVEIISKRSRLTPEEGGRLPKRRVTILCSATMGAGVQKLGDISLKEASFIKADSSSSDLVDTGTHNSTSNPTTGGEKFLAPAQLRQSYVLVPPKQRYVTLYALLKRAFLRASPNMKIIVFFSCADSVDFHFEAFTRSVDDERREGGKEDDGKRKNSNSNSTEKKSKQSSPSQHPTTRPALLLHENLLICKLHGSLPQQQRTESLKAFAAGYLPSSTKTPKSKDITKSNDNLKPNHTSESSEPEPASTSLRRTTSSIPTITTTPPPAPPQKKPKPPKPTHPTLLFSTDISSRGLDLPNVDLIIQFDPPFSRSDYLHRIGRTARAGRPGRAIILLLPGTGEEEYVSKIMTPTLPPGGGIKHYPISEILDKGFNLDEGGKEGNGKGGKKGMGAKKGRAWEDIATAEQLLLETHLTSHPHLLALAKRAWTSHVRAYATHEAGEREMFDVRRLHVGHLAKGFGLRERPGEIASTSRGAGKKGKEGGKVGRVLEKVVGREGRARWDVEDEVGKKAGGGVGGGGEEGWERMRNMARMLEGKGGRAGEFNIG